MIARSARCGADTAPVGKGQSVKKILYGRTVQKVAALFATVAALGAPKKW